jgi:uncharacterized protein YpuA (DUF1002 family)
MNEVITKEIVSQHKETLVLIKKLFDLVKQQREYNLLQDQQIEGLQNKVRKLEGRYK